MNAIPKPAPARSSTSIQAEITALEGRKAEAERALNSAATNLPAAIAGGDAAEIADLRREKREAERKVTELGATLSELTEALAITRKRERATARAKVYGELEQLIGTSRQEVCAVEDAICTFAAKLNTARIGLESVEAAMRNAGVVPDPYWLRAKLDGLVQMCLHLETDGFIGSQPTLDTHDQLRANGRASLKAAAKNYEMLALQRVRSTLGVRE